MTEELTVTSPEGKMAAATRGAMYALTRVSAAGKSDRGSALCCVMDLRHHYLLVNKGGTPCVNTGKYTRGRTE